MTNRRELFHLNFQIFNFIFSSFALAFAFVLVAVVVVVVGHFFMAGFHFSRARRGSRNGAETRQSNLGF